MVAERERGEPQAGGPALRAPPEPAQDLGLELDPAAASSAADSSSVNARSASRSSRIAPSRRRRPIRSAGSIRVEITMRRHARRVAQQPVEVGDGGRVAELVQVVEHEHDAARRASRAR